MAWISVTQVGMELLTAETNASTLGDKVFLVASLIAHAIACVRHYHA